MKINATTEEKLKTVYDCLTTGLPTLADSGIELDYNNDEYKAARDALALRMPEDEICIEDIQTEMLRLGFNLIFRDTEDEDEAETLLNLSLIEANWDKIPNRDMLAYVSEDWDADTACNIAQSLLYGEIVYG